MSDEAPQIEDTPNPEAPSDVEDTPTQAEIDWQKRYQDLRPEYDRKSQTLTDREAWLAHGQEQWPDLFEDEEVDDEPEFEDDAPEQTVDPRVEHHDRILAEIQYERDLSRILGDRDLSERGQQIVKDLCMARGGNEKALKAAVEDWFGLGNEFQPAEEKNTKSTRAPHVVASGKAHTGAPNYDDMTRDEVDRAMFERARALDTQN